jgi:hypothetical protein
VEDYLAVLIISVVCLVIVAIFLPLLFKRAKESPFLAYVLISLGIEVVMFVITANLQITENPTYNSVENLALIPVNVTYFFLYFYFESLSTVQPPVKHILPLSCFFTAINAFILMNSANFFSLLNLYPILAFCSYFGGMIIFIFGIWVFKRIFKAYPKLAVKLDLAAFVALVLCAMMFQITDLSILIFPSWSVTLFIVGTCMCILGIGLILANAVINPSYIYFIPQDIHALLLYNRGGTLLYERKFGREEARLHGPEMITGALNSFSIFFKENLGTQAQLNRVMAGQFEFYFETLREDIGTLVIIVSGANRILLKSLRGLSMSLYLELCDSIKQSDGKMLDPDLDRLAKVHFPYLQFTPTPEE